MNQETKKPNCEDYSPGPVMGRVRRVCVYYIAEGEGAGGCTHPDHFMCEHWLAGKKRKEAKDAKMS
jgi:hypothetical protein